MNPKADSAAGESWATPAFGDIRQAIREELAAVDKAAQELADRARAERDQLREELRRCADDTAQELADRARAERDHLREELEVALNLRDQAICQRLLFLRNELMDLRDAAQRGPRRLVRERDQARAEAHHARDIALWLVAEAKWLTDYMSGHAGAWRDRAELRSDELVTQRRIGKYLVAEARAERDASRAVAADLQAELDKARAERDELRLDAKHGTAEQCEEIDRLRATCGAYWARGNDYHRLYTEAGAYANDLTAERDEARAERDEARELIRHLANAAVLRKVNSANVVQRLTAERDEARAALKTLAQLTKTATPDPPTGVANPTGAEASATDAGPGGTPRRTSELLGDAVTVGLTNRLMLSGVGPSLAKLDTLIAEWRSAADRFASAND